MEVGSDSFHIRLGHAVDTVVASLLFKENIGLDWHKLTWRLESVYQDNSRTCFGPVYSCAELGP